MATHVGSLESMVYTGATFDIITMWDFLEHVDDPTAVLTSVRHALNGSGTLFVRTPNLAAAELGVFGNDYHSLKREHLHMFSPGSLAETLLASGFRPTFLTSESHLLQGFLGDRVARLAAEQRGSDLLAAAVKLGSE
jgi:2-polyprenyl-3-methyl-5-hydroxy-6-metoxy-1,4-benzoquinol methylase